KMKNSILFLSLFLLASCAKPIKITVENPLDFDRNGEIVEVATAGLPAGFADKSYVLKDAQGQEVAYQLLSDKQTLIFPAHVPANASATYTLTEGTPAPAPVRAHVRFVPERSDDMSWENDIAAYRMYGAALEKIENPSNGVDIWMKYKDEPVMDSIYTGRLERNLPYHEDCGLGGLDCYDVKHTLGAGGIAPYTSKMWVGDAFDRYEIVESGPLRSVFTLYYDTIPVEGGYYAETLTITSDAGSPLNKGVVKYEGADRPMQLATGIFMHGDSANTVFDKENRIISYTKNAFSNKGVAQGQTYIGVYAPALTGEPFVEDKNYAVLNNYNVGDEFTYYFGGGWSKWKFPTEQDWLTALAHFSQAQQNPLKVNVNQ
ncbi:MAG: DUF4861 domain-containing protein, partial [Dysgonamonadaceae bacterium]|nr:DUF4861 domain-containing protein [Dysgonamonadaceae bacterium]